MTHDDTSAGPAPRPARLWEHDHPFYGDDGQSEDLGSFAELQQALAGHPHDGSTVIYRWDWLGPHSRHAATDRPEELVIFGLFPRKGMTWSLSCPISKDQEAEVAAWLAGPDVLGQLTPAWTPILDHATASAAVPARTAQAARDLFTARIQPAWNWAAARPGALPAIREAVAAAAADPDPDGHQALRQVITDMGFGHDAGDRLARQCARIITQARHAAARPAGPPADTPPGQRKDGTS